VVAKGGSGSERGVIEKSPSNENDATPWAEKTWTGLYALLRVRIRETRAEGRVAGAGEGDFGGGVHGELISAPSAD